MLELIEVKKYFAKVKAVDGISFIARPGEIFGLIGPNGAGKTTTIRMIMNILAPDSGKILFSGSPLNEKHKMHIGYLPEERGFYKKVRVFDILCYFASLKSDNEKRYRKQIDLWLERFELMPWKYSKVEELSKGMSQKVQFIAAVAHEPDILFFDEPFSGLDPVSSDILLKAILELGQAGKTILFSTHIMEHAEKICSQIFLINKGREILSGSLTDIKNRFGQKTVVIEYEGQADFIEHLPQVASVVHYPHYLEINLKDGEPNELLRLLVAKLNVRRFEVKAPSLHNIFIQVIKAEEEDV